jgi:hypothetical protein
VYNIKKQVMEEQTKAQMVALAAGILVTILIGLIETYL